MKIYDNLKKELAAMLNVSQPCISQCLSGIRLVQKGENWVPHILLGTLNVAYADYSITERIHQVITGDECT